MTPAAAATQPPATRAPPKKQRWRYSHGLITRCRPGRGGVAHQPRRPFVAVLRLGAFIETPPAGCGAGRPATYKSDITLIARKSSAIVTRGRRADVVVPVTCPI